MLARGTAPSLAKATSSCDLARTLIVSSWTAPILRSIAGTPPWRGRAPTSPWARRVSSLASSGVSVSSGGGTGDTDGAYPAPPTALRVPARGPDLGRAGGLKTAGAQHQSSNVLVAKAMSRPSAVMPAPVQNSHHSGPCVPSTRANAPTRNPAIMIDTATHETARPWNVGYGPAWPATCAASSPPCSNFRAPCPGPPGAAPSAARTDVGFGVVGHDACSSCPAGPRARAASLVPGRPRSHCDAGPGPGGGGPRLCYYGPSYAARCRAGRGCAGRSA